MFTRSKPLALILAFALALPLAAQATNPASCPAPAPACPSTAQPTIAQIDQIMAQLMFGNALFSVGLPPSLADVSPKLRACLDANGQHPKGIILSCIDSRVPPELVFRQGLGDFFVSRIAGNVPLVGEIASVEYAVEHVGVPLVFVLGHTKCGAVNAAAGSFENPAIEHTPALTTLIDEIMPAIEASAVSIDPPKANPVAAVHVNAQFAAYNLLDRSEAVCAKVKEGKARVVVGVYDQSTGRVTLESFATPAKCQPEPAP
jgi:carbonic anhydrase